MFYPLFTDFLNTDKENINAFSLKENDEILNRNFSPVKVLHKDKCRDKEFFKVSYQDDTSIIISDRSNLRFFCISNDHTKKDIEFNVDVNHIKYLKIHEILNKKLSLQDFIISSLIPFDSKKESLGDLYLKIQKLLDNKKFELSIKSSNNLELIYNRYKKEESRAKGIKFSMWNLENNQVDIDYNHIKSKLEVLFTKAGCLATKIEDYKTCDYILNVTLAQNFDKNVFRRFENFDKLSTEDAFPVKQVTNIESIGKFEGYNILTDSSTFLLNGEHNLI